MPSTVHYSASVLADNPTWYWKLDETSGLIANDATGNNHTGTFNFNPAAYNGRAVTPVGNSVDQAGTSIWQDQPAAGGSGSIRLPAIGHLSIGTGTLGAGNFSVEFWIKPKAFGSGGNNMVLGVFTGSSNVTISNGFFFRCRASGDGECGIRSGDVFTTTDIPSGTFARSRSAHIVFTYDLDRQQANLYKDGRLFAGPKTMLPPIDRWFNFIIGSVATETMWNGHFDDVAVYRHVLSASRVQAHFDAGFNNYEGQVRYDHPKLYWRLGGTVGGPVNDSSDNSRTGSFFSTTGVSVANGLLNNDTDTAFSASNTTPSAYVEFTGSTLEIDGTNNRFSVEWMCRPNRIQLGDNRVGRGIGFFTAGVSGSEGEGFAGIREGELLGPPQLGPGFFQLGTGSHYVYTFDGNIARMYKNGELVASRFNTTSPLTWPTTDPFKVAVSGAWNGTFDEVAVYGYALPPYRVRDHWSQAFNLSSSGAPSPTFTALSGTRAILSGGDYLVVTGSYFQLGASVIVRSGSFQTSGVLPRTLLTGPDPAFLEFFAPVVPATGTYDVVVLNPDSGVVTGSAVLMYVSGARYEGRVVYDRPMLYWRLSDASGSAFTEDRASRGMTGTIGNSNPFLVYRTASLVVDGQSNADFAFGNFNPNAPVPFISITPRGDIPQYPRQPAVGIGGPVGAQSFTVEFWIKFRSGEEPFNPDDGTTGGTPRLGFNHPAFLLNVNSTANGTTTVGTDAPTAITASSFLSVRNQAHHVVYTYSASSPTSGQGRLYRDGVLTNGPTTQNVPTAWSAFQFLGPVSGTFDEVAVYDYPLSASQVSLHYETGILYNANDLLFGDVQAESGTPTTPSFQDLGLKDSHGGPPQPLSFNDFIFNFMRQLVEGPVASWNSEALAQWRTPFEATEGPGNLDSNKNVESLFFGSGTGGGGGGPTDTTPPTLSNFSPAFGTPIASTQVISFDITDNSEEFRRIVLHASFSSVSGSEVIHDGVDFNTRHYAGASNTRTPITGGFHFTVLRDGGWPSALTLIPFAIDESGNENV